MTTNNATPREAIENVIDNTACSMSRQTGYTSEEVWLDNPDECADAVIAHLWSRADDWETVQRHVATMLEGEVKCDVHPESYHHKLVDMAAQITTTIMAALIGPRPSGEENWHGQ